MAQSNVVNVLYTPGKLCKNPTNLALPFPHGGTELGLVRQVVIARTHTEARITAEEFGSEVVENIYLGEVWTVGFRLRTYDNDAIADLFPNTTVGTSGNRVISHPGSNRAGRLESQDAVKLCFSPLNAETHPMLLMYRAIPMLEETVEFNVSMAEPLEFGCIFLGIRDGTNRVIAFGMKGDLTL
jgi:hypothetical protein